MTVNRGWSAEADKLLDYLVRYSPRASAYMLTHTVGKGDLRRDRAPISEELHLRYLS